MTTNNTLAKDNNVPSKTIIVEKTVYEAVLRNSLRVDDLEEENAKLKDLLKECQTTIAGYEDLYGNIYTKNLLPTSVLTKINEVLKNDDK